MKTVDMLGELLDRFEHALRDQGSARAALQMRIEEADGLRCDREQLRRELDVARSEVGASKQKIVQLLGELGAVRELIERVQRERDELNLARIELDRKMPGGFVLTSAERPFAWAVRDERAGRTISSSATDVADLRESLRLAFRALTCEPIDANPLLSSKDPRLAQDGAR